MTVITLESLSVHNFKGIRDFTLVPKGNDSQIYGMNATGKTTIFDAFTWLLFGKNSEESKQFNVKPLDENGDEVLGLEPEVVATIAVDDKSITLKRVLTEVWTKPAGKLEKVRKPDKTVLYIDDVPQKVKEYEDYINSLIDMDSFKTLTNPAAFTNLKWDVQRSILMNLIPDIDDQSVLADHPELSELVTILDNSSVEDQHKRISAQKSQIKKDIDALPARIDEATRAIPETIKTSDKELNEMKSTYEAEITDRKAKASMLQQDTSGIETQQKIAGLNVKLSKRESEFLGGKNLQMSSLRKDINTAEDEYRSAQRSLQEIQDKLKRVTNELSDTKVRHSELASQYVEADNQTFDEHAEQCPTCGQNLPPDKVEESKEKFNQQKSVKLAQIAKVGQEFSKDKIAELTDQVSKLQLDVKSEMVKAATTQSHYKKLKAELESQENGFGDFQSTEIYTQIINEIAELRAKPDDAQNNSDEIEKLEAEIAGYRHDIDNIESVLRDKHAAREQRKRITELEDQDKALKQKFSELEKQAYLIDQFTRAKVNVIEDKLNTMFQMVSFKLFENQKNGELKETCEATVDGVPFSDLNNAARINAGLDIINTLTDYYGVNVPIFVDNAESVNELIKTKSQQISLIVSTDKKMKVVA
ncbi:AAA family ATPase [Lapidilactobacillus mulanensis]|uniref:Nuclease SbcCD subunit C n=1 Tax=Lapidilactobacillus mulanensis TaxID=2485999 RepID=A0ABW4DR28_9LACO|nr:AAA family ATPase [Lapidilactobacillus mulanensis]